MSYQIERCAQPPALDQGRDHPDWTHAQVGELTHFMERSSSHLPQTRFRLLHDDDHVYVMFHVQDHYIRCQHTHHQGSVCQDSCVEFFFCPFEDMAYFNVEVNCGGWVLFRYQVGKGEQRQSATDAMIASMQLHHSMPSSVEPEQVGAQDWTIAYRLPLEVLSTMADRPVSMTSGPWRGNFYKCADHTSHPHWLSWADLGEFRHFHCPPQFLPLHFA